MGLKDYRAVQSLGMLKIYHFKWIWLWLVLFPQSYMFDNMRISACYLTGECVYACVRLCVCVCVCVGGWGGGGGGGAWMRSVCVCACVRACVCCGGMFVVVPFQHVTTSIVGVGHYYVQYLDVINNYLQAHESRWHVWSMCQVWLTSHEDVYHLRHLRQKQKTVMLLGMACSLMHNGLVPHRRYYPLCIDLDLFIFYKFISHCLSVSLGLLQLASNLKASRNLSKKLTSGRPLDLSWALFNGCDMIPETCNITIIKWAWWLRMARCLFHTRASATIAMA